jgi:glycerol-3-phosphate dehydrogenase
VTRRISLPSDFDLCIIGGGATGAGCALDAQLRGLRTVLIEAGDFASRTSSASTKMAHGGVRYLQAAVTRLDVSQFRLVEHALRERAFMLRNAPHLARPMEFLVPCFSLAERLYYAAGMKMYDWIARSGSLAASRLASKEEALRRLPALAPDRLVGAVTYADGQFDDARFCLAIVMTFVRHGGNALNYARATSFERAPDGKITAVVVHDEISNTSFTIRARAFVNATGPFSDALRTLAVPGTAPRMRPSKGVHLIFPLPAGWQSDGMLIPKTEDGRVVFALPYNRRLMVGTTDDETSPDAEMVVRHHEIAYLLRQINPYLKTPLAPSQMVSGFAGIRPLVRSRDTARTSRLIRDDEVEIDPASGLISIMGGKWTTYRLMAEKTIDRVQRSLGVALSSCVTSTTRLAGSSGYHDDYWRELIGRHRITEPTARHLARKYGTAAPAVLALADADPELSLPLIDPAPPIRAEIVYAVRHEMALAVEDVLARRIGLELYDWRMAMEAAPLVARLMAPELGWTSDETLRAADQYTSKIRYLLKCTVG